MSLTDNVQKTAKTARCGLLDRAVRPGDIIVGDRLRALDRDSVERLKESISRIGLKTPISVRSSEQGWRLVSGRHRLEACSELGMDEIPIAAETGSGLDARLWEIAENLHPAELTALERAEHISQWIRLRARGVTVSPAIEPMTNWTKLGQFPGCTELLKWRSSRRRADAVAKAAFVPPPENSASRDRCAARGSPHRSHRSGCAGRAARQPSVDLPTSPVPSARRERDECLRHAEPSRCRRPGPTELRPVLRADLCGEQRRMGGGAAAAGK